MKEAFYGDKDVNLNGICRHVGAMENGHTLHCHPYLYVLQYQQFYLAHIVP